MYKPCLFANKLKGNLSLKDNMFPDLRSTLKENKPGNLGN